MVLDLLLGEEIGLKNFKFDIEASVGMWNRDIEAVSEMCTIFVQKVLNGSRICVGWSNISEIIEFDFVLFVEF